MATLDPAEVSLRSERSAYAETIPLRGVTAQCRGPVRVCAIYDDRWQTPLTMSPVRITDMNGVVLDGGARTQGLPSFGMQDGQQIDRVRPELGVMTFNSAQRGPITAELVPDASAAADIASLEAQILEDLRSFAASMETAMQPWLLEWKDQGWWGVAKSFFAGAKNGIVSWWEGEGDFWDGVWNWLSALPDTAADTWGSLSATARALWDNRHKIIELLQALGEGAVDAVEASVEALKNALAGIPGLEEIAETFRLLVDQSAEWAGAMIEMATKTKVLAGLGSTVMGVLMIIPPNFWADMLGTAGGYLIPEVILAVIFAVIAFFTAGTGGSLLAARLTVFVASVTAKLSTAGRAGRAALQIFSFLSKIAGKMVDLVKALKRGIEEVARGATDGITRIVRRSRLSKADFPAIGRKVSQKQSRHVAGRPEYRGGGVMASQQDAQKVLDEWHSGNLEIIGKNGQGFPVVRSPTVTGTNINVSAGYPNQPTNVFIIKGTNSPSVVPTNPNWSP